MEAILYNMKTKFISIYLSFRVCRVHVYIYMKSMVSLSLSFCLLFELTIVQCMFVHCSSSSLPITVTLVQLIVIVYELNIHQEEKRMLVHARSYKWTFCSLFYLVSFYLSPKRHINVQDSSIKRKYIILVVMIW